MDNVGIYTPPRKAEPVTAPGDAVFQPSLTFNELEVDALTQQSPYRVWDLAGGCDDAFIDLASREGGDTFVEFTGDGTASPTEIVIEDPSGRSLTLAVLPLDDAVRFLDEDA